MGGDIIYIGRNIQSKCNIPPHIQSVALHKALPPLAINEGFERLNGYC